MRAHQTAIGAVIAIVVALLAVAAIALIGNSDDGTKPANSALLDVANSFPAPPGSSPAFPDSSTETVATKGWRAAGALDEACNVWRDAYRNWNAQGGTGSVGGDYTAGQSCTLESTKDSFKVALMVAVYGTDPQPNVTLTVRR